jgi:trans-aconitate methyltransferase
MEQYRQAFSRHGDSPAGVLWPKGRQEARFAALMRFVHGDDFSVLDFGCGLAHLFPYLRAHYPGARYAGVDLLPEFIEACRKKYPAAEFQALHDAREIRGNYDFVLISGAFNILYNPSAAVHEKMVFEVLHELFARTVRLLAVNFMSDRVDYAQEGAYHQSVGSLLAHVRDALSPRFVLDHSYMPYEYTLTVFKDARIVRPDNVFHDHGARPPV